MHIDTFVVPVLVTVSVLCIDTKSVMLQVREVPRESCSFVIRAESDPTLIVKDLVEIIGKNKEEKQSNSSVRFATRRFKTELGLSGFTQLEANSLNGHVIFTDLIPTREGITKTRLMKNIYKIALKFTSYFERIDDSDYDYIRRSNQELNHTLTYSLKEIKCRATRWILLSEEDGDTIMQELQSSTSNTTWLECNNEIQCGKRDMAINDALLEFYDYIVESVSFLYLID